MIKYAIGLLKIYNDAKKCKINTYFKISYVFK